MTSLREKYINGELFKIGDIVLDKKDRTIHEVVDLGTNYVSVVDADGTPSKKWIKDIILSPSLEEDFIDMRRKRSSSNQIAFLGYKTKNFTEEHYMIFHPLMRKYKDTDKFAMLNLIRSTDKLIEEAKNITEENYQRVNQLFEQTEKLCIRFNSLPAHLYRKRIEESIIYHELTEGLKFTRGDKQHAAKLIATSMGIESNGHPHDIVNRAAEHLTNNPKSPAYHAVAKRLFDYASAMGIKWDQNKLKDYK